MKIVCGTCNKAKGANAFWKRAGTKSGRRSYCKLCARKSKAEWYERNKDKVSHANRDKKNQNKLLMRSVKMMVPCKLCGEKEFCCLDFHHVNGDGNGHGIAEFVDFSTESFRNEIEKCAVICSNCHRKIHANVISPVLVPIKLISLGL